MKILWLTESPRTAGEESTSLFVPVSSIIAVSITAGDADTVIRLIDGSEHVVEIGATTLCLELGVLGRGPLSDD